QTTVNKFFRTLTKANLHVGSMIFSQASRELRKENAMSPRIKTTVVGSYPVPSWLVGNTSRLVLRDAVMAVLKTQELAGLDLITDGAPVGFDTRSPENHGVGDAF